MSSSSDDEGLDDLDFEDGSDPENEIDEDILGALEEDLAAEVSEAEEDTDTDDSDANSDDDDDGEDEPPPRPPPLPVLVPATQSPSADMAVDMAPPQSATTSYFQRTSFSPQPGPPSEYSPAAKAPSPPAARIRSPSPAGLRRLQLFRDLVWPRSFTVEAICAIPHPVPTHSLAASMCMTHLITGSDDGYIRDYDIFAGVNGKVLLTAPQRHHCGVMEGVIKASQIRYWWENPADLRNVPLPVEETPLCAPYSMIMHSDALWSLAGTDQGHINLFTIRHEPGRLVHTMFGHRGPVSAMAMQHDEKGFYSAGWDGEALWDLNTGQIVRNYTAHPSQLVAIAVRPLESDYTGVVPWVGQPRYNVMPSAESAEPVFMDVDVKPEGLMDGQSAPLTQNGQGTQQNGGMQNDEDAKSDTSFDPLFDDPEGGDDISDSGDKPASARAPAAQSAQLNLPQATSQPSAPSGSSQRQPLGGGAAAPAPKNAPPVLDPLSYSMFSANVLMTASIDGQVMLWDKREQTAGRGVGRLWMSEKTPPWCVSACWSADGSQIYAGRRNGAIDVWDVRQTGQAYMGTPRILKVIRNPASSGVVSCVVAFPDGRHIACASNDNIRLWSVAEAGEPDAWGKMKSGVQFKIIPGHHGGSISQMLVDRQGRFLVSASSNRGWFGESSRTVFVHEVKRIW